MPKLVSIIVPVYNSEQYLSACIESILAQTYVNIELILINDGSIDNSGEICDKFANHDPRVKVIHQDNKGIASAQNAGLDTARGEHITFCDNDDLMSPYLIEHLVQNIEENNALMSTCRWFNVGASKAKSAYEEHIATQTDSSEAKTAVYQNPTQNYQEIFSVLSRKMHKNGDFLYLNEANWSKLYSSELWTKVRFPEGHFAQDVWVAMEIYNKIEQLKGCVVASSQQLYFWLQHPGSTSHENKSREYHVDIFDAGLHAFNLALDQNITPARSFGAIVREASEFLRNDTDVQERLKNALKHLSFRQLLTCKRKYYWRRFETFIYDRTVHRRT